MFCRQFCVFVLLSDSCIVMQHNDRFFVCRCCRLCELNRRRRVKRFKRRLRLRSCVYSLCVPARVFAPLYSVKTPSAVAVAVAAAALLPPPESDCCRCRCAAAPPPLPLLPPLPQGVRGGGGQGIESASAGGVSPPRPILTVGYSKTQTIRLTVGKSGN